MKRPVDRLILLPFWSTKSLAAGVFLERSSEPWEWENYYLISGQGSAPPPLYLGVSIHRGQSPAVQPRVHLAPASCTFPTAQEMTLNMATWCEESSHWKRPWFWERLKAGGEGDDRGWDGWMTSLIQQTWVWASSRRWWRTGKPGMLQSMGSQRVRHDWVTEQQKHVHFWKVCTQWHRDMMLFSCWVTSNSL